MCKKRVVGMEDLLPEQQRYRDEGCDLFPTCLNCPLPSCRYDEPSGRQWGANYLRNEEILRLRKADHISVKELARRFGLSKRSVYRIIKGASDE